MSIQNLLVGNTYNVISGSLTTTNNIVANQFLMKPEGYNNTYVTHSFSQAFIANATARVNPNTTATSGTLEGWDFENPGDYFYSFNVDNNNNTSKGEYLIYVSLGQTQYTGANCICMVEIVDQSTLQPYYANIAELTYSLFNKHPQPVLLFPFSLSDINNRVFLRLTINHSVTINGYITIRKIASEK